MRRKDATIKLNILTAKEKDKKVPIIVQGFYKNKQKVKYTNVWCSKKNWDMVNQRISSKEPNSGALNKQITDMKNRIVDKLNYYISNDIEYTLDDLFSSEVVKDSHSLTAVSEAYFKQNMSKPNTILMFKSAIKSIQNCFHRELSINEIDKNSLYLWRSWMLSTCELSNNSVRNYFSRIQALFSYAGENEIINPQNNPFLFNNFIRDVTAKTKHIALSEDQLYCVMDYFYGFYDVELSTLRYSFKKGTTYLIRPDSGIFFSVRFFLMSFYLQGLSPKDLLLLKREQFVETYDKEKEESYLRVKDVRRAKTGKEVKIAFKKTLMADMLFEEYLCKKNTTYLFPFMDIEENRSDKAIKRKISSLNRSLKYAIEYVNQDIINLKKDVPIISVTDTTLYSARHTFASLMTKRGAKTSDLAVMMGRDVSGIDVYIKEFQTEDEIIGVRDDLLKEF